MAPTDIRTEVNNHQNEDQDIQPLKFVNRMISDVPLVKSAVNVVEDGYDRVKGMNKISETTLTLAEKSFSLWARAMKPALVIFQRPINYADDLACDGLEKLEIAVPVIRKKPEDLVTEMKTYATEKLQSVKDYGVERIEPIIKTADATLNNAIDFANSGLPKADDKEPPSDANSLIRFKIFSNKLQFLISQRALDSLKVVKFNVSDSLAGTIELGSRLMNEQMEKVRSQAASLGENVKWNWVQVNREETEEEKGDNSLKQVSLRAARTSVTVAKYVHGKLPETVQQPILSGATYADHLFQELRKAENVNDVYVVATTEIHAGVEVVRGWIITHVPLANRLLNKEVEAA